MKKRWQKNREEKTRVIKLIHDQVEQCPPRCEKKIFRHYKGYSASLTCPRNCEQLKKIRQLGIKLESIE